MYVLLLLLKLAVMVTFPQETKFVKPGIKLEKFKQNISALAFYSSFNILLQEKKECARNLRTFSHILMTSEYVYEYL